MLGPRRCVHDVRSGRAEAGADAAAGPGDLAGLRISPADLPAGRRGKWIVLAGWVVILGVFGWLARSLPTVQDNDQTNRP
jgi:hypothetical protein